MSCGPRNSLDLDYFDQNSFPWLGTEEENAQNLVLPPSSHPLGSADTETS